MCALLHLIIKVLRIKEPKYATLLKEVHLKTVQAQICSKASVYALWKQSHKKIKNKVQDQAEMQIAQKEEAGIQLTFEEFDFMAAVDRSAEVHLSKNCYDNDIFNMFTQDEQYTELLEPIPEPHQVLQNDSNIIYEVFSVEQGGGTVEQHPTNVEETRALYDSLYNNLAIEFEKVKISLGFCIGCCMKFVLNEGCRTKLLLGCGCCR
uniref:Uncharacterized protein n=1 Tax=Tanacetum cinerariifolium TaxID=118510 RepID=A0A6L2P674_TANCI|nr:hypothetical protein [Tanacetum cinerariifolium]